MDTYDVSTKIKSSTPAIPTIYAYTTPEIKRHDGWTKIGYTEQDVHERIRQQTKTADVQYKLEWSGNAIYDDGTGDVFHDTDFHDYLRKLEIENTPQTEWFFVTGTESKMHFYEYRESRGILESPTAQTYRLRTEQWQAVEEALSYIKSNPSGEFLWNAKPRFGKTLTAYDLCKKLKAVKVLVVTNRPSIANSWYDDYVKFLGNESGYHFVSSTESLSGKPYVKTREEYLAHLRAHPGGHKKCIEFVSLQDLKGSMYFGGGYDKLKDVADLEWDVLIVDEAHEGVDTYKTDIAFDKIKRGFTLHLSGTPFKAIANEKFSEEAIFNWTYADEQKAKYGWSDTESTNPYADLPTLNMFTYQMSELIADKASQGIVIDGENTSYAFDLNEFFSTGANGAFTYNNDVDNFLDALTEQKKYPFSTVELRNELKHTFWILDRVDSAKALARKLQSHSIFKEYEIILAAGDGRIDDSDANEKALDKVRSAIQKFDKTITLSVGQLTTGVTIPEWTAVLMLSNMKSPALYMQAAFRAQNPCLFHDKGRYLRKENAYVFDFDPARTLTIFDEFANDLYFSTSAGKGDVEERKKRIRTLLNFFPVIGEDEKGQMVELDAEKVLSIPRKIRAKEVVQRGFMSDFLFQNISNIFRASAGTLEIIERFEAVKEPKRVIGIDSNTVDELNLNAEGEVIIPEEQILGLSSDIFGEKVYEEIEIQLDEEVDKALDSYTGDDDEFLNELEKIFVKTTTDPLIEYAVENYGKDLKPAQRRRIKNILQAETKSRLNRQVGDFKIQRNLNEKERESALNVADTEEERTRISMEHELRQAEAFKGLNDCLEESKKELVKLTGQTIVREVETSKKKTRQKSIEDRVRDHLRGFTRTIPSFLMAYGDSETKLANFDVIVPSEVFEEVTSITVDEFRVLRDGGECPHPDTGEMEYFEGRLFDSVVFDDAVKEFIGLRTKLANYFDMSQDEDIFDYVPPQKNNQIYTPKHVVKEMVDLFEEENPGCFDDPSHTFADLYMKSGLFITEIIKRIHNSSVMEELFPDERKRLDHILKNQVYGIAPTEIIYQISTHYILGYNKEIGGDCDTNFIVADSAELAKEAKLAEFVAEQFGMEIDA